MKGGLAFGTVIVVMLATAWAALASSLRPPVVIVTSPARTGWHILAASMEPTLHCAKPAPGCLGRHPDWPVVSPIHGTPARGDNVAFKTPLLAEIRCGSGGAFIQRIVGLPGEKWSEKSGYVYINGRKLSEPYVSASRRDIRTMRPLAIPRGHYFVMGDNRSATCDSRVWGTVPRANIIGDVTKVYREK